MCCAGSRLLVQERVAERLYEKVRARMSTLRVGSPLDKAIDIGAIVDKVQYDRIAGLVATGIAEGATCYQPEGELPAKGLFYKPTLLTDVSPASTVAQEEIFGPVLVAMTFRTPAEAVELANNTAYGLAASVWSENVNVALDVAAQVKAGVVWVNATNLFDAACGFGGYRESGYGREGGKEGMYEYLEPAWVKDAPSVVVAPNTQIPYGNDTQKDGDDAAFGIDRTVKQYIGGKQARPDSGYSYPVYGVGGELVGEAPLGSRKDVRNAVEAARGVAAKWAKTTAHGRAQILYFVAENLMQRRAELIAKLGAFVGPEQAAVEVEASIERTFAYAAWADKFEGSVHQPPMKMVTLAMKEPVGVVGLLAPEDAPLLGLLSLVLPCVAMGNTVVAVPSETTATLMAELYQVLDTSDVPGGVINLVAGKATELGKTLAEHDDVDAVWCFRDVAASAMVKAASIGNLKQVWTNEGKFFDWFDPAQGEGRMFLRHATQVKNVWVPYGE